MRAIFSVSVENFLSFERSEIKLGPLNVLVGPNGAGKSNFLKIFQFLRAVATDDLKAASVNFNNSIFRGGRGLDHGQLRGTSVTVHAAISANTTAKSPDEYSFVYLTERHGPNELYSIDTGRRAGWRAEVIKFHPGCGGIRLINISAHRCAIHSSLPSAKTRTIAINKTSAGLHILPKLGDEFGGPQVDKLANIFATHRFLDIDVDAIRRPGYGQRSSHLEPNASNLVYFLSWLESEHPIAYRRLSDDVAHILPGFRGLNIRARDQKTDDLNLEISENHLQGGTSLAQASYGTIRAIALLAALHDPNPPRLTCIEEIDQGFHPHALDRIVERMREASKRTQLIVTTHSPALVNRLLPKELIILERDPATGGTHQVDIRHRDIAKMEAESGYRMGELWFSGMLGGGLGQET